MVLGRLADLVRRPARWVDDMLDGRLSGMLPGGMMTVTVLFWVLVGLPFLGMDLLGMSPVPTVVNLL